MLENWQSYIFSVLVSYFAFLFLWIVLLFVFKLMYDLIMIYIVKNKKYDYLFKIEIKDNHYYFYKFRLPLCSFFAAQQAKIPINSCNNNFASASLISQLVLLNFKMRNSLFCQNINNGGCGLFAYYTFQKLNELAKKDSNLKAESIHFVFINSNNKNINNPKCSSLNIDYKSDLSEQFNQLHNSSWNHILVAFTYCDKQFYLDGHRLFSDHLNFVNDRFDDSYITTSNNFQLIENNVTFDLLKTTVTIDNDNKMRYPYWNDEALKPDNLNKLFTKNVSFADIKTELLFFLNQICL